jgi:hypothetical protein
MNAQAEIIVDAIIRDLSDRRGLRHEWEAIDDDIKNEIRDEWLSIVSLVLSETGGSK